MGREIGFKRMYPLMLFDFLTSVYSKQCRMFFLFFYFLVDLLSSYSIRGSGMLKCPTLVELSVSSFISVSFFFMNFGTFLLSSYMLLESGVPLSTHCPGS